MVIMNTADQLNCNNTACRGSLRWRLAWLAGLVLLACISIDSSWAAEGAVEGSVEPAVEEAVGDEAPLVHLIRVPLPISGNMDRQIQSSVDELLARWQRDASGQQRPILVIEFRGSDDAGSATSQFERALSLARFLSGERLSSVRTVAYLSGPVRGHAVLPVLACEEIMADPESQLGRAGEIEPFIDDTIRSAYREIAQRRRTIPVPVVLGMLDANLTVYRIQTLDGARYALEDELEELKEQTSVSEVERIVPPGEMAQFSGSQLRLEFGFASHVARNRAQLSAALRVPLGALREDPTLGQGRRALRVDVSGKIQGDTVTWLERSLRDEIDKQQANFICVVIDSPGGSPSDSLRLASYLAGLDPGKIRTVAFVATEARSDAALIALACDELVMSERAVLGGPGARRLGARQLADIQIPIKQIAETKQRGWSLMMAMVDPELTVRRYRHQEMNVTRLFSEEEHSEQEDADRWVVEGEVPTANGLRGEMAQEAGLALALAENFADFASAYQLEEQLTAVRPNWAHRVIEFLALPQVAGALLFIGWFALMFELMSPGVGLPGFVAAVCFLLFFWSSVLHGTAGWLEILLFLTGVICILMEIFVIPGFGAFGIGGALLVVASIVLASQTFVLPRNAYEWSQVPNSLLVVAASGAGIIAALACMRRVLTQAPVFRRVALETPDETQLEQIRYQESMVHFEHLLGKRGVTTTPLLPSGKAQFGDEVVDVMSDGELIQVGTAIAVAEVHGNEVMVRKIS
jgi:membrane-bound serine protease (ClpP class)